MKKINFLITILTIIVSVSTSAFVKKRIVTSTWSLKQQNTISETFQGVTEQAYLIDQNVTSGVTYYCLADTPLCVISFANSGIHIDGVGRRFVFVSDVSLYVYGDFTKP